MDITPIQTKMRSFQDRIIKVAESLDTQTFLVDEWTRESGGGGRTCVLTDGSVFEQAGVNFSHVFGENLPPSATAARPELAGRSFDATGVSVVMHPKNPYAPTSHFNVRLFCAHKENEDPIWWVGGGFDLTPYYGFEEDCIHWHQCAKDACDKTNTSYYPKFKKWCDDYFYLKHRSEARGIGGIFFDDLTELDLESALNFLSDVTQAYCDAYSHIIEKRHTTEFTETERNFQLYRRGRYVEFNLVYDRGTLFGLQSGGRTESILMSLPPIVNWQYNYHPTPGTPEAELYEKFLPPRDWV